MNIPLTAQQKRFVLSEAKYPAFVGGFGSGKSHALVVRTLAGALSDGLNRAFLAPTYDLLRLIAFPRFEALLDDWGVEYKLSKSDGTITLENEAQIFFRTMETPERIVGFEVADAALDELDTLKQKHAQEVWRKIIARCRLNKPSGQNTVAVGTTPEGFRFVYDRWVKNGGPDYEIIKAPTTSNPTLPSDYVASLIAGYPANLIDAYLNGDFVNLTTGSVYSSFSRTRCGSTETIQQGETLHIGQDFNVGKMASCVFVNRAGVYHQAAELMEGRDTPAVIETIKSKWPESRIRIYPDASGGSRKTVNSSTSDHALFEAAGFVVVAPRANPPVRDRINSVNAAFEHGKIRVNSAACPETARCLEQQSYDKNGEPDKTQGNDHSNDAFGYFCHSTFPIIRPPMGLVVNFIN